MRTSLIIFGVIFLVIGGLLYFVPMQEVKADTTTVGDGGVDTRTSSARITVPVQWAYSSVIIGFILLIFGMVIPTRGRSDSKRDSYDTVVESKENIEVGRGNKRKIIRERTERRNTGKGKDDN